MHCEELHSLFPLPSDIRMTKSRKMNWTGHVILMSNVTHRYRVLIRPSEGNRPLERTSRVEGNIKMGFKEIGCESMDHINLTYDRDNSGLL
jgi:hypothetical protein